MSADHVSQELVDQAVAAWLTSGPKSFTWETVAACMLSAVLPAYAHELAEQQRAAAREAADTEHPKLDRRAPVGLLVAEGMYQAADLIDAQAPDA